MDEAAGRLRSGSRADAALLAVVADDLTGAVDTGAGFSAAGLSTVVTWPGPDAEAALTAADVIAIDMGTRVLDEAAARQTTSGIVEWARGAGVSSIYKKCDSILRGHIGVEVGAALASWHARPLAVAALAFPDAGRITRGGLQYAREREAALPIAPVFAHAGLSVRGIDLETVRGPRLREDLAAAGAAGIDVALCDAVSNADLANIARAGLAGDIAIVWVGTGGLARALAAEGFAARRRERPRQGHGTRRGPVLTVVGSATPIARAQAAQVAAAGAVAVEVPADALGGDAAREDLTMAVQRIQDALSRGQDVVVSLWPAVGADDRRIADALGAVLRPFGAVVGGVAVTGGDTATAVLRAWGVTALHIVGEVEPGVPVAVAAGLHPIAVVTKAGAFGGPDALVKARTRLHMMSDEGAGAA